MRAVTHPPHITRPRLVVCPECGGTGHDYEYPINPSARPHKVPCTVCNGEGAYEKPAAKGASARQAGAPACPPDSRGASTYDATNDRWLSRPSGVSPAAGVPADLGRSTTTERTHTVLRSVRPTALQSPSAIPQRAEGYSLADKVVDAVTVASGLAVFGMLAMFLMVIA